MKSQITSRIQVELLVNTFYDRVKIHPVLGPIFNDMAKVDWTLHLPKMYNFWASILLGEQSYDGNPMTRHIQLSRSLPLTENEFNEWITLFTRTVDDLFEGEKAEEAKTRAANIARLMLHKIQSA